MLVTTPRAKKTVLGLASPVSTFTSDTLHGGSDNVTYILY